MNVIDRLDHLCFKIEVHKGSSMSWEYLVQITEDDRVIAEGHALFTSRYAGNESLHWPMAMFEAADSYTQDLCGRAEALLLHWADEGEDPSWEEEPVDHVLFLYHFRVDEEFRGHGLSHRMVRMLLDMPFPQFVLVTLLPGPLPSEGALSDSQETQAIAKLQRHWYDFGFRPLGSLRVENLRLYGHHLNLIWPVGSRASKLHWWEAA